MSNKNTPNDLNTATGNTTAGFKTAHNGHSLTHVGQVANPSMVNSQGLFPATFDVWYCQLDHQLLIDNIT